MVSNNVPEKVIQVLLADDSPTVRRHLTSMIEETDELRVIGEAHDGEEVVKLVQQLKPDVVSMDIRMPRVDGLEATRQIMALHPTPVVVVSGLVDHDIDLSFQAVQAGALAVVEKPPDRNSPAFLEKQRELTRTLIAMAGVRVIHHWTPNSQNHRDQESVPVSYATKPVSDQPELIAIGASAGGPTALSQLLQDLPITISTPIVIAQHMPNEFISGLARWLNKVTPLQVQVAADGLILEPGVVNLAPGDVHIQVARRGGNLAIRLIHEPGPYHHQPSIDVLFHSVAEVCGAAGIGLVLTGMGDDGATGLLAMHEAGAYTFAQDESSSTVYGMPGAAVERGAVKKVLSLANMASAILELV